MLNARLRAANLAGVPVAAVGEQYDLTYPVEQLGAGADVLDKLAKNGWAWRGSWDMGSGCRGPLLSCRLCCASWVAHPGPAGGKQAGRHAGSLRVSVCCGYPAYCVRMERSACLLRCFSPARTALHISTPTPAAASTQSWPTHSVCILPVIPAHACLLNPALFALGPPSSDYLKRLKGAQRPMVIVGAGVLQRADRGVVLQKVSNQGAGGGAGARAACCRDGCQLQHGSSRGRRPAGVCARPLGSAAALTPAPAVGKGAEHQC